MDEAPILDVLSKSRMTKERKLATKLIKDHLQMTGYDKTQ